jgi:hypothetical protein
LKIREIKYLRVRIGADISELLIPVFVTILKVARMGEVRNAYRKLVETPESKTTFEIPRLRTRDNIKKMDLGEVGMTMWTASICLWIGSSGRLL